MGTTGSHSSCDCSWNHGQ